MSNKSVNPFINLRLSETDLLQGPEFWTLIVDYENKQKAVEILQKNGIKCTDCFPFTASLLYEINWNSENNSKELYGDIPIEVRKDVYDALSIDNTYCPLDLIASDIENEISERMEEK